MNNMMRGKIEACIELSDGNAEQFRFNVMKTTSLTFEGFHNLNATDVAYEMLKRGESINDVINATL